MGLDPADNRPAYRQVAAQLRHRITTGRLQPGDQLPSLAVLTEEYGISPMTARAAIRELSTEGLVVVRQGQGAFVLEGAAGKTEVTLNDLVDLLERVSAQVDNLTDRVAALETDQPAKPAPKRKRDR